MNHEEGTLAAGDGLDLYWQSWQPPGDPEGVLLFVHGLAEHSGRYLNPVRFFVARGWTCYGIDYRGHGKSPGLRVHVNSFDEFVDDLRQGHHFVCDRNPGRKVFLVGHSQGGLLTLLYTSTTPDKLAGAVVSSPFLGIHPDSKPSPLLTGASKVLSLITPKVMVSKVANPAYLSRDPGVERAYVDDPLVSHQVSMRWATALIQAQRSALEGACLITTPTLVMQAGSDRLVDPEATRTWVASAPGDLVEYTEWDGYYHELFNEPMTDRRPVFERMATWLEAHRS